MIALNAYSIDYIENEKCGKILGRGWITGRRKKDQICATIGLTFTERDLRLCETAVRRYEKMTDENKTSEVKKEEKTTEENKEKKD